MRRRAVDVGCPSLNGGREEHLKRKQSAAEAGAHTPAGRPADSQAGFQLAARRRATTNRCQSARLEARRGSSELSLGGGASIWIVAADSALTQQLRHRHRQRQRQQPQHQQLAVGESHCGSVDAADRGSAVSALTKLGNPPRFLCCFDCGGSALICVWNASREASPASSARNGQSRLLASPTPTWHAIGRPAGHTQTNRRRSGRPFESAPSLVAGRQCNGRARHSIAPVCARARNISISWRERRAGQVVAHPAHGRHCERPHNGGRATSSSRRWPARRGGNKFK